MADHDVASVYLADVIAQLQKYKALGEGALGQIDDRSLTVALDEESNSIAVIVKHLRGNMLSRWTDFLTADGEKPDRMRDAEFELQPGVTRADVLAWWDEGWDAVFAALAALGPDDLVAAVRIRGETMPAVSAINRQLAHYAYHVGQIVYLAKHFASEGWRSLSIPRGASALYGTAAPPTPGGPGDLPR